MNGRTASSTPPVPVRFRSQRVGQRAVRLAIKKSPHARARYDRVTLLPMVLRRLPAWRRINAGPKAHLYFAGRSSHAELGNRPAYFGLPLATHCAAASEAQSQYRSSQSFLAGILVHVGACSRPICVCDACLEGEESGSCRVCKRRNQIRTFIPRIVDAGIHRAQNEVGH